MKTFYKLLIVCALGVLTLKSSAQSDSLYKKTDTLHAKVDTAIKKPELGQPRKAYFKVGVSYLSNDVYLGRVDTISPTITDTISYTLKCGIYFMGSLDYITTKKVKPLDAINLETGYNYIGDELEFGFSYTKLFFNKTSTEVASAISSIVNTHISYDIGNIFTPAIDASYNIADRGGKNDIVFNPSISHEFSIGNIFGHGDEMRIGLGAAMNAGTQNFFDGYLVRKTAVEFKGSKKFVNQELIKYNQNLKGYQDQLSEFKVLDYELSAPIVYRYGHFIFTFIPTYAFPRNGLTAPENIYQTAIQEGIPKLKSNEFNFSTGIAFRF